MNAFYFIPIKQTIIDYLKDENCSQYLSKLIISNHRLYNFYPMLKKEFHEDKEFVIYALKLGIECLSFAPKKLKSDREVIECAVSINGYSLEHASSELRDDKKIVLIAINATLEALKYASHRLYEDSDIIYQVLLYADNYNRLDNVLYPIFFQKSYIQRSDINFMKIVVSKNPHAYKYANDAALNSLEIALNAVKLWSYLLEYVPKKLLHRSKKIKKIFLASAQRCNAKYQDENDIWS